MFPDATSCYVWLRKSEEDEIGTDGSLRAVKSDCRSSKVFVKEERKEVGRKCGGLFRVRFFEVPFIRRTMFCIMKKCIPRAMVGMESWMMMQRRGVLISLQSTDLK